MVYNKSQTGWAIIFIFTLVIIHIFLSYTFEWGNSPLTLKYFLLLTGLFTIVILLFYKLTVEINGTVLKLTYGIGLIKFSYKIDKLEEIEVVKNPWYYGFGIRITTKGMLYNIQGLKAIRLCFTNGGKKKCIMVGTSEPKLLKKALKENFTS